MGYKGLYLALALLLFPIDAGSAGVVVDTPKELPLARLHRDLDIETRCGVYFGYEKISGTDLKRISFNYESEGDLLFCMVAYSTMVTEIDNSRKTPVVEYTASGEVLVKISEEDYKKETDCLPPPKVP
jgi:hypothetical protein